MTTAASRSWFRSGPSPGGAGPRSASPCHATLGAAERLVNALPCAASSPKRGARLEERRVQAERALGYVELYGAYSETEARFRIDRTLRLFESSSLPTAPRSASTPR